MFGGSSHHQLWYKRVHACATYSLRDFMRVGQVQEDEARKSAQLAAEKDQERKRKYQEVEEEAEAEEAG